MKHGDIISLFPEGTTNDGAALLPFKSSFFSIAKDQGVEVQPVSLVYTALSGNPITDKNRLRVGWYGDAEFFPHVMNFLRERSVEVTVIFHASVQPQDFASRKELALYCHDVIEKPLQRD